MHRLSTSGSARKHRERNSADRDRQTLQTGLERRTHVVKHLDGIAAASGGGLWRVVRGRAAAGWVPGASGVRRSAQRGTPLYRSGPVGRTLSVRSICPPYTSSAHETGIYHAR